MNAEKPQIRPLWRVASEGCDMELLAVLPHLPGDPAVALNQPGPYGWAPAVFAIVGEKTGTEAGRAEVAKTLLAVAGIPRLATTAAIDAFSESALARNVGRANRDKDRNVRAAAWLWACELAVRNNRPIPKVPTWIEAEQYQMIRTSLDAKHWRDWSGRKQVLDALDEKEQRRKDAGYKDD